MGRMIELGSRGEKDVIACDSSKLLNDVPRAELSYQSENSGITSKTPLDY